MFEGHDEKHQRYLIHYGGEVDDIEEEELELEECDESDLVSLNYNKEEQTMTYFLSGEQMYNDGEGIEYVKISLHTLLRFLYTIPDGGL